MAITKDLVKSLTNCAANVIDAAGDSQTWFKEIQFYVEDYPYVVIIREVNKDEN